MAAQVGVFFFDMRSSRDRCDAVTAGLHNLATEGVSVAHEDGVVLGHGTSRVWRREHPATQPLRFSNELVSTWDGRLDNARDLELQLHGRMTGETTDHELALAAFDRWGLDGLRRLIGDWSIVIWNRRDRVLHLARDCMGVRPLYYCACEASVMWSSGLGELAERAGRVDALSEPFVAAFLAQQFSSDLTPYEGIRGVPCGACVTFSASAGRHERRAQFWRLQSGTLTYRERGQYEEHLRALWREAVETRLKTTGDVWTELSGGLDSSSVVCMANVLLKSDRMSGRALRMASHATLRSPEGDERRFIAEVERQVGVRSTILGVEDHQDLVDERWGWITPCAARGVGLARVRQIQELGGRLVLSGRGGDAVMGCEPDNSVAVLDDLANGDVLRVLRNMRAWSRACRKPFVEIGWNVAREWLGNLPDIRPSKRRLGALILAFANEARLNLPNQPPGITFTYPFFHRPLVDFVMSIPGEELSAPGETRSLMRRAFAPFVPRIILGRTSKGYYPPSSARATRAAALGLRPVGRLEVADRGWIDPARLDALIGRVVDGGGQESADLRRVLRLEEWLRLRHRRGPSANPQWKEVNTHEVLNA
jgi:asparagine synthase (glutamine-hydrolysing)